MVFSLSEGCRYCLRMRQNSKDHEIFCSHKDFTGTDRLRYFDQDGGRKTHYCISIWLCRSLDNSAHDRESEYHYVRPRPANSMTIICRNKFQPPAK